MKTKAIRRGAVVVSPVARLTPEDVRALRRKYQRGETQAVLARDYKVSQATISNIIRGKIYAGVPS